MTLTMAAVLSLAAQCAPAVAPDTIASIAMAEFWPESARHPRQHGPADRSNRQPFRGYRCGDGPDRGAAPQCRPRIHASE